MRATIRYRCVTLSRSRYQLYDCEQGKAYGPICSAPHLCWAAHWERVKRREERRKAGKR